MTSTPVTALRVRLLCNHAFPQPVAAHAGCRQKWAQDLTLTRLHDNIVKAARERTNESYK